MKREPIDPESIERMIAEESDSLPPEVEARMSVHVETLRARIEGLPTPSNANKESWIMATLGNLNTGRARWATALALVLVLCGGAYILFGTGSTASSYAAVVERLQKALTATLKMKVSGVPNVPEMNITIYRKEPGMTRMEVTGGVAETISIVNTTEGRVLSLIPDARKAVTLDLGTWKESDSSVNYLSELDDLKSLPAKADEATVGQIDGRRVHIYLVRDATTERRLWVDDATGDLVRCVVDWPRDANAPRVEMSDLRFDVPLDDALFSTVPPAGYEQFRPLGGALADMGSVSEQNLLDYLKACADSNLPFPSVLDPGRPFETSQVMAGLVRESCRARSRKGEKITEQMGMQEGMRLSLGAFFVGKMKPENDFHYAGANVMPGNPADWICWWKPTGATHYRVVHGDLSITDATAEEVAAHKPTQ